MKMSASEWLYSDFFMLKALDTDMVETCGISDERLIYLRAEESPDVLGPFDTKDFKAYLKITPEFPTDTLVKTKKETNWVTIYAHTLFSRRTDSAALPFSLKPNTEYHLLINGQKQGPFDFEDLAQGLAKKEILITDQVSTNGGKEWGKLYNLPQFDRRKNAPVVKEQLPYRPADDSFQTSAYEINKLKEEELENTSDAIVGIALMGNIKTGNDQNISADSFNHEEVQEKHNYRMGVMIAAVLAVGIFALVNTFQGTKLMTNIKKSALNFENKKSKPINALIPGRNKRPKIDIKSFRGNTKRRPANNRDRNRPNRDFSRDRENYNRNIDRDRVKFRETDMDLKDPNKKPKDLEAARDSYNDDADEIRRRVDEFNREREEDERDNEPDEEEEPGEVESDEEYEPEANYEDERDPASEDEIFEEEAEY